MNANTDESHGAVAGQVERSVRPHALAEALRGIADGFDQQRPWFRPDPLVMSTLRRAADELDKAGDAVAAERERWRDALEEIADGVDKWTAEGMAHLAREALGPNVRANRANDGATGACR